MSEHKLPREINNSPKPELFQINDPEMGKTYAVRDLTDQQIQRFMQNALAQQQAMMNQSMQCLQQAHQAAAMGAVLGYEADRRARSITLATPGDVRNLRTQ